ncbi:histidine phosphatase family protein [Candidatus Woesearchaeota archaeon]|nr:histidine phosphatase family protein [Candidatus Woesearchaeota archaeon]MBW3005605.1 histidine phosphatase family protein [Candidatus Woesearchaeota archaeon]
MAKYITVYLVRHGETFWNVKNITQGHSATRLTEKGIKQSEKIAEFFKDIPLARIYCSPLFRARQTAKRILKHHPSSKLVNWQEFVEIKSGAMEGLSRKKQRALFPEIKKDMTSSERLDWRPPGGESVRELYQRVIKGFNRMMQQHKPGEKILVITHGGVLLCLLLEFQGKSVRDLVFNKCIDNCEIIKVLWDNKPKRIRRIK